MAMMFYNRRHPGTATSAGTQVDIPGQKLGDRPKAVRTLRVMHELGFDMSDNVRTQLTPELIKASDLVVMMAQPETIPSYALHDPKIESWQMTDPLGMPLRLTRDIRDLIQYKVQELDARLHQPA